MNYPTAYTCTGIQAQQPLRWGLSDADLSFPAGGAQLPNGAFLTGPGPEKRASERNGREVVRERHGTQGTTLEFISTAGYPSWLLAVLQRLLPLTKLPANWDSYGSLPPSFEFVQRVVAQLNDAEALNVAAPDVVPMAGGGIQLEWGLGNKELEIAFLGNGRLSYLVCTPTGDPLEEDEVHGPDISLLRKALDWARESTL
jgi:hypothetical protein